MVDLVALIESGSFLEFLSHLCPLDAIGPSPDQPGTRVLNASMFTVFNRERRHLYSGRVLAGSELVESIGEA
jgi:hypothetical protein